MCVRIFISIFSGEAPLFTCLSFTQSITESLTFRSIINYSALNKFCLLQIKRFVLFGLSFSFTVFRCNFVLTHRSIAFGYMADFLCVHWFASNFVYFSVRQFLICQLPRYYKQFVLVLLLR